MQRTRIATACVLALVGATTAAGAWNLPAWLRGGDVQSPAHSAVAQAPVVPSPPTAGVPAMVSSVRAPATDPVAPLRAEPLSAGTLPNYRAIVQTYGPAVVGVTVSGLRNASADNDDRERGMPPQPDEDPLFRFFRGLPGMPGMRGTQPHGNQPFRGQGSGFIVSADGLILTNAHVVRDAKRVTVKLSDRREYVAKVLGSDPASDVAVLKVDARGLPTVAFGDAKAMQVGDWVLAIGAPYGFEQTATQGIVSAKGRSLPGDNSYVPFIQTDAAVNPGNSGGPLFDAGGRVIGINAQIYSQSGGFQGLAFAIPVDVALRVKDQIVAKGHVEHARLGVTLQDLSAPLAQSFGLPSPDGALVSTVAPKSAAAQAALQPGDVITAIDGQPVHTAGEVSSRVGMAAPGERIRLGIWRDKSPRELTVALGKVQPDRGEAVAQAEGGSLGLTLRPLDRSELQRAGTDHGLLVEDAAGPAAQAGINAGDVVLALNGRPVQSVAQMRQMLGSHPSQVALLIARGGQQIFVPVDLG